MTNYSSHSPSSYAHLSEQWHESQTCRGVAFAIRNISLGARLRLTRDLRELLQRHDFLRAGDLLENTDADLADLLVRRLYLEYGLKQIRGLLIDGLEPSVLDVIEKGPESLSEEIVAAIRASLELTGEERKN